METGKFNFGNVVMIENGLVGVVVKCWGKPVGKEKTSEFSYEVYVRDYNGIKDYKESEIRHFIYDKELSEEDLAFY